MLVGLGLSPASTGQLTEPEVGERLAAPPATFFTPVTHGSCPHGPSSARSPAPKAKNGAPSKCLVTKCRQQSSNKQKPPESIRTILASASSASEQVQEREMYTRNGDELVEAKSATQNIANVKDWRKLVARQWKMVKAGSSGKETQGDAEQLAKDDAIQAANSAGKKIDKDAPNKKSGFLKGLFSGKGDSTTKTESVDEGQDTKKAAANAQLIPQTFEDMGRLNAMLIGANMSWIAIVIDAFDQLVVSVVNDEEGRLEKETRILALRMHREAEGSVFLSEYKVCMLASLRQLLPKIWDTEAEQAWGAMWDTVQQHLEPMLPLPAKYGKNVEKFVSALGDSERKELGLAVFERLFKQEPKSENYFLQSNDRLCFIVQRAFGFSSEVYQEPRQTVDAITQLGLKHIMYGIPTQYFLPFVACCLEELHVRCEDPDTLDGFDWSMHLVASIMVQAIQDGSNPLLTAVIKNNPKQVRRELAKIPRGQRAAAALGGYS